MTSRVVRSEDGAVVLPTLPEVDVAVEVNGARFCDLLLQRLTAMSA